MPSAWDKFRVGGAVALSWVATTVAAGCVALLVMGPQPCSEQTECAADHDTAQNAVSRYAMCALATSVVLELISLYVTWKRAQVLVDMVQGVEVTFVPPLLLCAAFSVLILENMSICNMWFIHAAAPGVGDTSMRPVYSSVIMEWLVNVPILLCLCGACALGRPLRDVTRPVIVTNLYIILSWSAYFIVDVRARWIAIAVAFAMYAWASVDMVGWVTSFKTSAPEHLPAKDLRCSLCYGLIFAFFVYGLIYLAAMTGLFSSLTELFVYIVMDVTVKLSFLLAFVGIRSSQFYELIVDLLVDADMASFDRGLPNRNGMSDVERDAMLPLLQ